MIEQMVPELLAPAGSFEVFMTAVKYGADAVYLGGKSFNLRAKAKGFDWDELKRAVEMAHTLNKKIYFCLNIFPRERDVNRIKDVLFRLEEINIDAVIISDVGVIELAREILSDIPIHLSTQANSTNSLSVRFWRDLGVKRINLARELSHLEIYKIRKRVPDIELEVFVHGAMCLSYSGRCLLSEYLNQRHANLGLCTQPCRYEYRIKEVVLEEKTRPGKSIWRLCEDEDYMKILSCEDLCLVGFIKWFLKNKINALKIEGRTKTSSYVGPVVDVYKTALKDAFFMKKFRTSLYINELLKTTTRDFSTGFFLFPKKISISLPSNKKEYPVFARIVRKEKDDRWLIDVKHKFLSEDPFEVLLPGIRRVRVTSKEFCLEDMEGVKTKALHSGQQGYLRCESKFLEEGLLLRKAD